MQVVTRMAERDQPDTLAAARAGDELAFRRIIAEHHEDMRRVCLAVCGDHEIAEEATQAAWFIAWKKLDRVYGPMQLRPWLVSVAVNEARKLMRKRQRRARLEVPIEAIRQRGGADPATGVASLDLRQAIARLEAEDRALLAMRFVAGFDSNELAAATGISASGTRSRIERLLKRLRRELRDG